MKIPKKVLEASTARWESVQNEFASKDDTNAQETSANNDSQNSQREYTEEERGRAWAIYIVGQGLQLAYGPTVVDVSVDGDKFVAEFTITHDWATSLAKMLHQKDAVNIYAINDDGSQTQIRRATADAANATGKFDFQLYESRAILQECIDNGLNTLIGAQFISSIANQSGFITYTISRRLAQFLNLMLDHMKSAIKIRVD